MKLNINLMVKGEPENSFIIHGEFLRLSNFHSPTSPNWRFGKHDDIKQHVRIILNIFIFLVLGRRDSRGDGNGFAVQWRDDRRQ